MRNKMKDFIKQPKIYQQTDTPFWTDDYISQKMLENHLDPSIDGASRNRSFIKKSASWICQKVPPADYPSLLDLGCGPGLYSELFAESGYQVTGVDFSKRSIDYAKESARKKQLPISYLKQDYLEMELTETFDLIVMIYCDFGALSANDRHLLVANIYRWLKPGGKFLLDVFSATKYDQTVVQQSWEYSEGAGFWSENSYLALNKTSKYPNFVWLDQTMVITQEDQITYNVWTSCFTEHSLAAELAAVGFKEYQLYSNVCGESYTKESETIAMLLKK